MLSLTGRVIIVVGASPKPTLPSVDVSFRISIVELHGDDFSSEDPNS